MRASPSRTHHKMYLLTSDSTSRSFTRACTRALSTVMTSPSAWSGAEKEISCLSVLCFVGTICG